jgi:transposase
MLVKILFYGYMNSTFSSRKLAEKTQSDIAFMFLSGGNKPDFRTIARFRKEK